MNRTLWNRAALLALALMLFAFVGCSSDDDNGTGPTVNPVDEFAVVKAAGDEYFATYKIDANEDGTREMGVNMTPDALAVIVASSNPDYLIVDWRSATDFAYAHIPGAVNKSLANIATEIDTLPTDKVLVNVCYTGQTASFVTSLINLIGTETGHKSVNLKFGMSEWAPANLVKADGTFVYATDSAMSGSLTSTPAARAAAGELPTFETGESSAVEILKARAQYAASRWGQIITAVDNVYPPETKNTYLVNYFSRAAYETGHLPGAVWYDSSPCEFTSEASLATLPTDKPVAVYCYTGQTSAQLSAYLTMLGYDAKSVKSGLNAFAYDHAVNTVPWHAPTSEFPLEGTYNQ